ncbi:MAG: prolipoprotein diacylglyceryl transferase [Candidatus Riflebacteria bacterium]|nr:prolipoprotein diacylglyceryl transferase [Candidatus Riflebacteria bacterium]
MNPIVGHFYFPITAYGICLSLAFAGGILSGWYWGRQIGFIGEEILDLALWFVVSAMIGARGLYIILFPSQFPTYASWIPLNRGGLVFYGGFIGTTLAVLIWSKWYNKRLRDLGDLIAPSLAIGQAIGRLGCFFNGCCYGRATTMPWGIAFPNLHDGISRHPTQLYESAFMFILTGLLSLALRRRLAGRLAAGMTWGYYVCSYATFRFLIEFIRDDERGGFFTPLGLSVSQVIAVIALMAGVGWILACRRLDANGKGTHGTDTKSDATKQNSVG